MSSIKVDFFVTIASIHLLSQINGQLVKGIILGALLAKQNNKVEFVPTPYYKYLMNMKDKSLFDLKTVYFDEHPSSIMNPLITSSTEPSFKLKPTQMPPTTKFLETITTSSTTTTSTTPSTTTHLSEEYTITTSEEPSTSSEEPSTPSEEPLSITSRTPQHSTITTTPSPTSTLKSDQVLYLKSPRIKYFNDLMMFELVPLETQDLKQLNKLMTILGDDKFEFWFDQHDP